MRCPYCGNNNADTAQYCARCGRPMTAQQGYQQPQNQPQRPRVQPVPQQPARQPQPQSQPQQARHQQAQAQAQNRYRPAVAPISEPPAPEPPGTFPPHTIAQLNVLEQGAQDYEVVDTSWSNGQRKFVRITYPRCAGWQQAATLFKAFKAQLEERASTIIIQGFRGQEVPGYSYDNGQLTFDHNVRLGDDILNRFQIETDSGFEANSIRFVLMDKTDPKKI